jgi:hypothetical protein
MKKTQVRQSQNFSFGIATLDLEEKLGFRPVFPKASPKTNRVLGLAQVP